MIEFLHSAVVVPVVLVMDQEEPFEWNFQTRYTVVCARYVSGMVFKSKKRNIVDKMDFHCSYIGSPISATQIPTGRR